MVNNVWGTLNYQTSRFLPMSLAMARGVNYAWRGRIARYMRITIALKLCHLYINKPIIFCGYYDAIQTFAMQITESLRLLIGSIRLSVSKLVSTARGLPACRRAERAGRVFCKLPSLEVDPTLLSLSISLFKSTDMNPSEAIFCISSVNLRAIPQAETKFIKGAHQFGAKLTGSMTGVQNSNWPGECGAERGWGTVEWRRQIFAASWTELAERAICIHEPTMDPCSRITLVMYNVCSLLNWIKFV